MEMTVVSTDLNSGTSSESNANASSPDVWSFVSAPDLHPMMVTINVNKPGTAPGFIFVSPYASFQATLTGQTGSLIMDQAGNPVWFGALDSRYTQHMDFRVQTYNGQPVLTRWQGTVSGTQSANPDLPYGDPESGAFFQILDQHYQVIKTLTAQNGFTSDVHEFTLTERNTALVLAVKQVAADLTPYGGPADGFFDNYSIQEVDLATGELVFFWDVLAHVDPNDSILPVTTAASSNNIWDCYHLNSVEEGPDNTLLVSMRNMCAIYKIDKGTGNIIWQLGGKQNNFTFGPNARFSWQHHARHITEDRISLFNDNCSSPGIPAMGPAQGMILQLDFQKMTANVERTYYHDPALTVATQGSVQKLPNGNQFVGWGMKPYASEFGDGGNTIKDASLNLLYDMQFPSQYMSYRAYKNEWVGLPLTPPSIAVDLSSGAATVYASWNGSTETVAWQVLAGTETNALSVVEKGAPRAGFETKMDVHSDGPYFQVMALDSSGQVIGESTIVHAGSGAK
ncbi:MAG TPA: arylsulfotransferase family protein [Gallionella sp.]|nr:arylsulfotransferase family protein [Gallionella sp.]